MKVIFRMDKDGNFDSFFYPGNKVPPFIPPKKRNEPKDTGPPPDISPRDIDKGPKPN